MTKKYKIEKIIRNTYLFYIVSKKRISYEQGKKTIIYDVIGNNWKPILNNQEEDVAYFPDVAYFQREEDAKEFILRLKQIEDDLPIYYL